jgi:hypothetical protein
MSLPARQSFESLLELDWVSQPPRAPIGDRSRDEAPGIRPVCGWAQEGIDTHGS